MLSIYGSLTQIRHTTLGQLVDSHRRPLSASLSLSSRLHPPRDKISIGRLYTNGPTAARGFVQQAHYGHALRDGHNPLSVNTRPALRLSRDDGAY